MWIIDYGEEAKNYLLDNYPYTFDLHIRIEMLKHEPAAMPPEGLTPADEADLYFWLLLEHVVVLSKIGQQIIIEAIKPL
jgi:hypothetical protein